MQIECLRVDAKRIVAYVLAGSALGLVFFVFFLLTTRGEDLEESTVWARGASFTGVITSVADDRVSVEVRENEVRDFRVGAATRWVMLRNQALTAGDRVRIISREVRGSTGSYSVARKVIAMPAPSPSAEIGSPGSEPGLPASPGPQDAPSPRMSGTASTPGSARPQPSAFPDAVRLQPSASPDPARLQPSASPGAAHLQRSASPEAARTP